MDLAGALDLAHRAASAGGRILATRFGDLVPFDEKLHADIVTPVDRESEEAIIEVLKLGQPEITVLSEERGWTGGPTNPYWLVDPLDGTSNYCTGIAHYGVAVALMEHDTALLGVVHAPHTGRRWGVIRGRGRAGNYAASPRWTRRAPVAFARGHGGPDLEVIGQLADELRSRGVRTLANWAPALDWCLLAEGLIQAVVVVAPDAEDFHAGMLIAREHGARIFRRHSLDGKYDVWAGLSVAASEETARSILDTMCCFRPVESPREGSDKCRS